MKKSKEKTEVDIMAEKVRKEGDKWLKKIMKKFAEEYNIKFKQ